jgi:hypothetical protein
MQQQPECDEIAMMMRTRMPDKKRSSLTVLFSHNPKELFAARITLV